MALVASSNHSMHQKLASADENGGMNVFFRFVDGKTLCLWLVPTISIAAMKQALVEHNNNNAPCTVVVAARDLFMVYNSKPLTDDMLLKDYGVTRSHQPVIWVNQRQRGGCFMISLSILFTICAAFVASFCTCGLSLLIVPVLLPFLFILPLFCL